MKCDYIACYVRALVVWLQNARNKFVFVRPSFFVFAATGISFIYLLSVSWLRWGNLFVDTPRELWLPAELLKGRVLYRDLIYPYGFFPPYFQAFLYKVFGVSILTQAGCGIALTLAMSAALYKIARFFLAELLSGFIVAVFLFVFAFGYYLPSSGIFNFILPYSFAAVFFIVFVAWALYFFLRFVFSERRRELWAWAFFMALGLFCRIEFGIVIWLAFIFAWLVLISKNRRAMAATFLLCVPVLIAVAGYACFIVASGGLAGFKESVVDITVNAFKTQYVPKASWPLLRDLKVSLLSCAQHAAVVFLLAFGAWLIASSGQLKRRAVWRVAAGSAVIIAVMWGVCLRIGKLAPFFDFLAVKDFPQFYFVNALFFIFTPFVLWRTLHGAYDKNRYALLVLLLIALASAVRIVPRASVHGKGLTELVLAMAAYYVFFFKIIPEVLQERIKNFPKALFVFALVCCFVFPVYHLWRFSKASYLPRRAVVYTDYGSFRYYGGWPNYINEKFTNTVAYLKESLSENDTVAAFPHGIGFNFFAGRRNPSRYYEFGTIPGLIGQERIIADLERSGIDYFVMVKDQELFPGSEKIFDWILERYFLVAVIGPGKYERPMIGIFKRKAFAGQNTP